MHARREGRFCGYGSNDWSAGDEYVGLEDILFVGIGKKSEWTTFWVTLFIRILDNRRLESLFKVD